MNHSDYVQDWVNYSYHSSNDGHHTTLPSIDLAEASHFHMSPYNNGLDDALLQQSPTLIDYTCRSPMVSSDSGISSDKENDANVFLSPYATPVSAEKTNFGYPPSYLSLYMTRDEGVSSLKERMRQQMSSIPTQDVIFPESVCIPDVPVPKHPSSDLEDLCQKPESQSLSTDYGERCFLTQALSDVAVECAANGQLDESESVLPGAAFKHDDYLVNISDEVLNQVFGEGITDNKLEELTCGCACPYINGRKQRKRQGPLPDIKRPRRTYFVKQMRSASDTYVYSFPMSTSCDLCSSTIVTPNGGSLVLSNIPAGLFFDEGCITGSTVNASLSVSFDNDSPPIQFNQLLMSIVMRCGPSGETFKRPVTLEVPHSANLDGDERKNIQVWCKSRNPDGDPEADAQWNKVYDAGSDENEVDIAVQLEYIQIFTHHFCDWGILYDGPVDMVVLMLLNMTSLNALDEVYVKVLVMLKEFVKEACVEEKKAGWHVCSVSTTGVMFKVKNNEKPLHVRIFDVAPRGKWHNTELTDVIPYEYLQKGRAKIEFSFRKKPRISVLRIKGRFNIYQDENEFRVPNSFFDSGTINVGQDRPPTPGYPNPPSNGSLGYMSASPSMSPNVGSVLSMQPPSVESIPPASVQSQGKDHADIGDEKVHGMPDEPSTSQDKNQVPVSPTQQSTQIASQEMSPESSASSAISVTPQQEKVTTVHQTIYNIETQYNVKGGQTIVDGDQTNGAGDAGPSQSQAGTRRRNH